MKTLLLALCPVFLLAACTNPGVRVTHTDVASGAVNPKAIYIRPFQIACAPFDECEPEGNTPIRKSLAPRELANDLQEQLAKIAPARVLEPGELAPLGWVVDGVFESVESGYAPDWWTPLGGAVSRKSCVRLHVRVRDVGRSGEGLVRSGGARGPICPGGGAVVYEFDVAAKTKAGTFGSLATPGLGYPLPFDFRNAAELIALTLTPDPFKYGYRGSPVLRY